MFSEIEMPAAFDAHVHLREGPVMDAVVPTIRSGGVNTVFVMPNLVPPITTVKHCLDYQQRLQALDPKVNYLMSLYLHPDITPDTIVEAKKAGITGVKSYPAGVTTNSSAGVVDYEAFYPVFEEMERQNMVLNLHGESPPVKGGDITVLNAEERFLPTLKDLHRRFPKLRIILEHCTTALAVEAVKSCGPEVAGTITAHHLFITVDDWAGDPFCFCKPVAKTPEDKNALLRAMVSGNPKFFLGTDSAPHPFIAKTSGTDRKGKVAAGVFTQPYAVPLVLTALDRAIQEGVLKDEEVTKEKVKDFCSVFGRTFYQLGEDESKEMVRLEKDEAIIMDLLQGEKNDVEIVPFLRGQKTWSVAWQ